MRQPGWSDLVGVALTSGAAIAAQVALTRVTSITLWHHFAFLVVGVALLGFGIAGAWLTARGGAVRSGDGDVGELLARRSRWAAASSFVSILAMLTMRPNALELFNDASVGFSLLLMIVFAMVPFVGAGAVIGTALSVWPKAVGRVYAADLIGGGVAAALAVFGLSIGGALGVLACTSLATALASIMFSLRNAQRFASALTLLCIAVVAMLLLRNEDAWIKPAPTKELAALLRLNPNAIEHRAWTPHGRIDVSHPFDSAPLVAGDIADPRPRPWRVRFVTQDGAAPTTMHFVQDDASELTFLPHATTTAVWALRGARFATPPNDDLRVLVIGVGGGVDVLNALAHGAGHVDGVEVNPAILALHTQQFPDFVGIAKHEHVNLVEAEGRSFIRGTDKRWDVIQLAGVDTFTALASGAYSLAEAHVYTLEAFDDYLARLSHGGCLSVSRLFLDPPRETLRLAMTAVEAVQRRGVAEPWRHVAIVRGRVWSTLLTCEQPLTQRQRNQLRLWSEQHDFKIAYAPGHTKSLFARALTGSASERVAFASRYPYRIDPATDERPFFFNYFRWSSLRSIDEMKSGSVYAAPVPIGHGVQLLTLMITALLAAIGIVGPLRGRGASLAGRRSVGVYFACLGAGFLLAEVALIERLTFFLGHPTNALAVVLSALLVASGAGSAMSQRLVDRWGSARLGGVVVTALIVVAAASHWLLPRLVGWSHSSRTMIALLLVAALGFVLGIPFPHGIRQLRASRVALIPWAFGVNAFLTVVAASLAPLFALEVGFSLLLIASAAAYVLAFRALPRVEASR
jgi:spermidine synthase